MPIDRSKLTNKSPRQAVTGALGRRRQAERPRAPVQRTLSWLGDKSIAILALLLSCFSIYQTLTPKDDLRLQTVAGRNAFLVREGNIEVPIVITNLGTANAIIYDIGFLYRYGTEKDAWFEFFGWGDVKNRQLGQESTLIDPKNVKILDLNLPESDIRNSLSGTDGYSPYQIGLRIRFIGSSGVLLSKDLKIGQVKVLRDENGLLIEPATYPPKADMTIEAISTRLTQ